MAHSCTLGGEEASGVPGDPSAAITYIRLLAHHRHAFNNSTPEHGGVSSDFQGTTPTLECRNLFPYIIGVLCGITIGVIFNLHLMCFKCSGPYKRSGYESFPSKSELRGVWWTRKPRGERQWAARATAWSLLGPRPWSPQSLPGAQGPRVPRCCCLWAGETASGEKTKKGWSFPAHPHLFFPLGCCFTSPFKTTETKPLHI